MTYLNQIKHYKGIDVNMFYPHITLKSFTAICYLAETLIENIPSAHNRKKKEAYHAEVIRLLDALHKEINDIKVGDEIVYSVTENLGNKKFPDNIFVTEIATVKSVTDKSIMVSGHRLKPYQVRAIIRKEVK